MRPKNSRYDTDILRQAKDILRHFDYNCTHLQTCMKWFQVNRFSINTKYAMNMTCNTFLLDEILIVELYQCIKDNLIFFSPIYILYIVGYSLKKQI